MFFPLITDFYSNNSRDLDHRYFVGSPVRSSQIYIEISFFDFIHHVRTYLLHMDDFEIPFND